MQKHGIITLNISKFSIMSSGNSLKSAYHAATGSSCEVEREGKCFVDESGAILECSPEFLDWHNRSYFNSLSENVTVIINYTQKRVYLVEKPPDTEQP